MGGPQGDTCLCKRNKRLEGGKQRVVCPDPCIVVLSSASAVPPTGLSGPAGDTVMHMPWTWPWKRTAALAITDPVLVATQSQGVMRESQRELAAIEGVDAFYPSHDDGLGVSPEQLSRFVAGVKKA